MMLTPPFLRMSSDSYISQERLSPKPEEARSGYFRLRRARARVAFVILVLPALIWFLGLMVWPLFNMFYLSFFRWNNLLDPKVFTGFANYARMFQDEHFWNGVRNSIIYMAVVLPMTLLPGFMLGFFLTRKPPGARWLRLLFFLPSMLSVAAVNLMFVGVYLPDGILNSLLRSFGLDALTRVWLANPQTALGAVIAVDIWSSIGFYGILFYASLSNLSEELFEAARLDGANVWDLMWRIALPLSRDFFGVAMVLNFIWVIYGSAQNVLILTKGGPGDHSLTLGYYLYNQAFVANRMGYSQAIAVFAFVVGLLGILLIRRLTRRSEVL
jgi:multiple sugar transport system permease protein